MSFQTWVFAAFFILFFGVYLLVHRTRISNIWLLIGSYVFYAWEAPHYLPLLVLCTCVDYAAVMAMARSRRKKLWLVLAVCCNLSVLGFFKYCGFVVQNLNWLLEYMRLDSAVPNPGIALPLGISFFTFQSLTYTMDFYRGKVEKAPSFLQYAAFVAFFPKLVMGPIERYSHMRSQFDAPRQVTRAGVADGASLFVVGLFKKVVLADSLGAYVGPIYGDPAGRNAAELLLATFAFGWQIYFDFSGYADMARGLAKAMGFDVMLNFNNPYLATGLGDFWRRWHISLSTWFRDYVYIPLGGNRGGELATHRNVFLTMVISGLWHGAAWTFVIWGALHGIGSVLTRELERSAFYRDKVPAPVKQLWVYLLVNLAWIFFNAKDLDTAWLILTRIFGGALGDPRFPLAFLAAIAAVWAYQFLFESRFRKVLESGTANAALALALLIVLLFFNAAGGVQFIYIAF